MPCHGAQRAGVLALSLCTLPPPDTPPHQVTPHTHTTAPPARPQVLTYVPHPHTACCALANAERVAWPSLHFPSSGVFDPTISALGKLLRPEPPPPRLPAPHAHTHQQVGRLRLTADCLPRSQVTTIPGARDFVRVCVLSRLRSARGSGQRHYAPASLRSASLRVQRHSGRDSVTPVSVVLVCPPLRSIPLRSVPLRSVPL